MVDIFAGAGGLGEGFEAFGGGGRFHVALSAEMDRHAVATLRTRAFFHSFPTGDAPKSYYHYLAGTQATPWGAAEQNAWQVASERVCQIELGRVDHDKYLDERISAIAHQASKSGLPWVLVGGPPCQAFSLVGRARNRGIANYVPENDGRHFLYQHYLHILAKHRPAVFVLENVKGMLSSQVGGEHIFAEIFQQLTLPGGPRGPRYRIEPVYQHIPGTWRAKDFIVRCEKLGIPQNRHRVILLGILEDLPNTGTLDDHPYTPSVLDMIGDLPEVRSDATDQKIQSWPKFAAAQLASCARYASEIDQRTSQHLRELAKMARTAADPSTGAKWFPTTGKSSLPKHLRGLMYDKRLKGVIQHQTRPHMTPDLQRYAYASAFAWINNRSPKGAAEFPEELHPEHRNWTASSHFVDRFKVQRWDDPSSTITSHLAKDGHYFIHPDPRQMRSLTVREAARLQTFPDNFIFEGPSGAQRKQVGNAVPPWLGHEIASLVSKALR